MSRERLYSVTTDKDDEIIVLCHDVEDLYNWIPAYEEVNSEKIDCIACLSDHYSTDHNPDLPDVDILL